MARRTPDYTQRRTQGKNRQQQKQELPSAGPAVTSMVMLSLAGAVAMFLWGCGQTLPYLLRGGAEAKSYAQGSLVAVSGLVTNLLVGVIAYHALHPRRFPLRGSTARRILYAIVFFGGIAIVAGLNTILGPAMIPAIAVFYFAVRPRLKQIAQAQGRYTPTKRDQALEEIRKRREERLAEKERQTKVKRRLARAKTTEAASGGASRSRRPGSSSRPKPDGRS